MQKIQFLYLSYNKTQSYQLASIFCVPGILSGALILMAWLQSHHPSFVIGRIAEKWLSHDTNLGF